MNGNKKYLIGGLIGLAIGLSMIPIEAAIPPTPALKTVNVDTSPWAGFDTDVTANLYNDKWFYVAGEGIGFNVTETYP